MNINDRLSKLEDLAAEEMAVASEPDPWEGKTLRVVPVGMPDGEPIPRTFGASHVVKVIRGISMDEI